VDLASEQLLDVDPLLSGVQSIELAGTFPKLKMQVLAQQRQLLVGATGGTFDAGGIEIIDLDTLTSQGLVIREADGLTGADLGPFVMVSPEEGYLAFTTDFTLSSHLQKFSISAGVDPAPLHVAVDYLAPELEFEPRSNTLFFPHGGGVESGVHVFDAATGQRLTANPMLTSGPPTDLVVLSEPICSTATAILSAMTLLVVGGRRRVLRRSASGNALTVRNAWTPA
jgi:hypothetical protein